MAERRQTWTDSETAKLLEVWSEEGIQAQLRGAVRNEVPFRKIAEELQKAGYQRSYQQCREKIKALKKKYKEVVDRLRRSGIGTESDDDITVHDFKWFADMHGVMKNRAVANPKHVVDNATFEPATPPSTSGPTESQSDGQEESPGADVSVLTDSVDDGCSETQTASATSETSRPQSTEGLPPKKKRKKTTKIDRAEKASNDIMDRILKAQAEERKQAADMERERRKWEEERAKRETEREDAFLGLFSQLIAKIGSQQQPPYPQQQPHPVPQQQMSGLPYNFGMYAFNESDKDEELDN